MRTLGLLAAVCLALQAYSAPLQMTKVIPVPGLGDFTLGAIGPTAVPNANAPNPSLPGGVSHRRSTHEPVNLMPRQIHSADFAASPNATLPTAPETAAAPSKRDPDYISSAPPPGTYKRDFGDIHRAPAAAIHKRAERKKEYHAHMRNQQQHKDDKFDVSQFGARNLRDPPGQVYDRVTHVDKREPQTAHAPSLPGYDNVEEVARRSDEKHVPSKKSHHKSTEGGTTSFQELARRVNGEHEHEHETHHLNPSNQGSDAIEQLARRAVDRSRKPNHKAKTTHSQPPAANTADTRVRPQDNAAQNGPSGPAAYTSNLATSVKTVGALPHALSGSTNAVPVTLPDTPLTSADNSAAEAAASQAAAQAAAAPHPVEEEVPAAANADAYPHVDSYKYTDTTPAAPVPGTDADANLQSAPNVKRHSLVMDTDPLLPPQDMTGKDPSMGTLNLDSNRPAEDVPAKTAEKTVPVKDPNVVDPPVPAADPAPAAAPVAAPDPAEEAHDIPPPPA